MKAEEAIELIQTLEQCGIEVYVDGGWAVDALLGEQTRLHQDLDIALPCKHVPKLRELLEGRGYREVTRDDSWECNFVLVDARGRVLDVHSYVLDDEGNNAGGVEYRAEHLTGKGFINGCAVRCISPEWLVKFHSGYELDENDFRDVRGLCERFGIAMPRGIQEILPLAGDRSAVEQRKRRKPRGLRLITSGPSFVGGLKPENYSRRRRRPRAFPGLVYPVDGPECRRVKTRLPSKGHPGRGAEAPLYHNQHRLTTTPKPL